MAEARPHSNDWLKPINVFASGEDKLKTEIKKRVPGYMTMNEEWDKHIKAVDDFLVKLEEKILKEVEKYNGEIVYRGLLKQSSARQGLKIGTPNEFDMLIRFEIQGLGPNNYQESQLKGTDGQVLPDLCKLILSTKNRDIDNKYPKLNGKAGFLTNDKGTTYIHSQNFLERVWIQIIDKAVSSLRETLPSVQRRNHPPAININTRINDLDTDFDIVPALVIGSEEISIPATVIGKKADVKVSLEIFRLLKYDNHNLPQMKPDDRPLVWREDTSAHEIRMADLCRCFPQRQYIMTAQRILKAAIKDMDKTPLGILISSYHLKTVAYHCVLRLTMMTKERKLNGVKDAFGYQITYLEHCIRARNLPEFFHGNKHIGKIFPGSFVTRNGRQVNLFWKENPNMVQAALSNIATLKRNLVGLFTPFEEKDVAFLFD